jgi:serine protease Do
MNIKRTLNIFLVACIGGIVAIGASKLFEKKEVRSFEEKQHSAFVSLPGAKNGELLDFTHISAQVTPAVVHIISTVDQAARRQEDFFFFFDMPPAPGPSQGSGSGVIISQDGYIATNNHVIENASNIQVVLNDKRSYRAELIGHDPQTDLALLKIDEDELPFVRFGNSDEVKVGEWVLAVGNPFNLTSTVTAGIVSAKGRNINLLRSSDNRYAIENFIQTDAAVNPGNSGGALVSMKGDLIGINTAIASQTGSFSGYSFAVPVSIVKKVMDDLLKYGSVQRGFLGISIQDIDARMAEEKGLKKIEGVYVMEVNAGGAADEAGIKPGDVILKVGEVQVNSTSELQEQVSRFYPGDDVQISVLRKNDVKSFKARLKNQNGKAELVKSKPADSKLLVNGAELKDLTREERASLNLKNGVKVIQIQQGAFKEVGIEEGFIITRIDKKPVYSAKELYQLLGSKSGAVLIEGVDRQGREKVYGLRLD